MEGFAFHSFPLPWQAQQVRGRKAVDSFTKGERSPVTSASSTGFKNGSESGTALHQRDIGVNPISLLEREMWGFLSPMGCTIDHLSPHRRVSVLRDFTDALGSIHHKGETAVITRIGLDWPEQRIEIEWDREGKTETLVFDLKATSGPGNGRMRDYFEAHDLAIPNDPGKRFVEGLGLVSLLPPELPPLSRDLITDLSRRDEALERIRALAGRQRFAEAGEQLKALASLPCDLLAVSLAAAAEHHAFDPAHGVYEWLRDQAIQHWYAWGAQATGGGEGAARLLDIYPAMDQFKRLDRGREELGCPTSPP